MKDNKKQQFQTSIKEPRWQQVVSIALFLIIVLAYAFAIVKHLLHH